MKNIKLLALSGLFIFALACNSSKNKEGFADEEIGLTDSTSVNQIQPLTVANTANDTTRKFIRTADIKFKVSDVVNATYKIEDAVKNNGGFVTFTNLSSEIINTDLVELSADSSIEITKYNTNNSLTIRVPNSKLDTTLKEISKTIEFLDYRVVKADDVALQLLGNDLAQQRQINNEKRLKSAIDKRGKKLSETTAAEELLINKQEKADEARLSNLSLKDQINFSTVNIYIYQKPVVRKEILANAKSIKGYEPGFGSKVAASLAIGFEIFEDFLLFLVKIWTLVLIGFLGYYFYKNYKPSSLKS